MTSSIKHPGPWLRETYLEPRKISVTEAAKLIGVSRPGVSNFLNGRVSTTEHMASRIERAFGVPKADLLRMQAEFDAQASMQLSPADTKVYIPPFLGITANEIAEWADHNIAARSRLSVFLRTLVHSTGVNLAKVDFPGNDDAERPGWDGFTDAAAGTPWIPEGRAGWEFGVNQNPKTKADGDFAKSVRATKAAERANTTFIFVTPRRWPGKLAWTSEMKAKNQWKDVRAYDASDLEQWIEQSPAAQTWLANETLKPSQGVRSLDKAWEDWSNVSSPPLSGLLFETAKAIASPKLKSFLDKSSGEPFVIAADSVEEALAMLAQVFEEADFLAQRDRMLVFDEPGTLPRLAQGSRNFIAVVHTREVERELGPLVHHLRSIIIYPRNATTEDPDITLEPLGYEPFQKGLEAMGLQRDDINKLGNESGHSLTVLRRRLSKVEAVRKPAWAADPKTSSWLIPMMMIGVWNTANEADKIAVSLLAGDGISYDEIERRVQELLQPNDAPIWSVGSYRGVISKIDALFAISHVVTLDDISRYLVLAKMVLGEDDPALDLPAKDRWWADMQGKRREFSGALRGGVSQTLVLLAVHGKHLFRRLGFDGEQVAAKLIRDLLTPLTTRKLEANDRDLPVYAEAAPNEFLAILERDLQTPNPEVFGLLRSVETDMFGVGISRSGLLWALENLAWSPQTFLRAVLILGRLAEVEIKDNWSNRPINSLASIFRAWMPQTSAGHEERVHAVAALFDKFPTVGWKICIDQFGAGNDVGDYSHKPKWRPDGYGFGEPLDTWEAIDAFRKQMLEMALTRPVYSANMICDLVERLRGLDKDYQDDVWSIIRSWAATAPGDRAIAQVREKIRVTVLSRRGRKSTSSDDFISLSGAARKIYEQLEPTELVDKHEWLFRQSWVDESADELLDEDLNFQQREERVRNLRVGALKEIYQKRGFAGIFELSGRGSAQAQIGWHMVRDVLDADLAGDFILEAFSRRANDLSQERKNLISGALSALERSERESFLMRTFSVLGEADFVHLLLLAPFEKSTWSVADEMSESGQAAYWQDVHPSWIFDAEEENNEAVERLLRASRPRAAFASVHFQLKAIRPPLLMQLLEGMARGGNDRPGEYKMHDHDLKEAFELLDRNPDITIEQKAGLEFAYIDVLADMFGRRSGHMRNLEQYVEDHPELWIQALVWAYRRRDRGEDPPEYRTPENREDLAERGYRLLNGLSRIPGHDADGNLDKARILSWVTKVREAAAELDRLEVCDICLGQLFARAPEGEDGVWPCEPVRDVFEELNSEKIFNGAHTGLYNSRGAQWRGEGGDQERNLAAKYRQWAEALQFTHPALASSLLMGMVTTYEREAEREDTEAGIRRRLRH